MLMKNNNTYVIKRLAKDSYQKNRSRNRLSIVAITATIVLVFSLCMISLAQVRTKYIELAREMGNEISITLDEADSSQFEKAKTLTYLDSVGKEYVLFDGYINNRLIYKGKVVDEKGFQDLYASLYTNIHGGYPQKENEIMLSTKMLSLLDGKPKIGEEITLDIAPTNHAEIQQRTFIVSGYYEDYAMYPEYYDIFFSSVLLNTYPTQPMSIIMKHNDRLSQKEVEKKLYQDITMKSDIQKFNIADTISYKVVESIYGNYDTLILLIGIILLSMFLLINNISQIALEKSIQEFGLLRTIGTTKKQLYAIQRQQFYKISLIALILGILLSIFTTTTLLPIFLKGMITKNTIDIDHVLEFNIPLLLILSSCVLLITFFSMMLPIRKVCKISSKDALYFTFGKQTMRKKEIHRKKPLSMYAMAWRNITSNKAKLCKVLSSLFLSSILCLSCVIIIQFMDNRASFKGIPDFILSELGMQDETIFLNNAFIKQTKQIKGIQSVSYSYQAFGKFHMGEEVWKPLMKSGKKKAEGLIEGGFQIVKDDEIKKLSTYLKHENIAFDEEAFKEGKSVFNLHRHVFSKKMLMQAEQVNSKTVNIYNKQDEWVASYQFQGYLDYMNKNFPVFENMSTNTNYKPYILISEKGFEKTGITKTISSYSIYVNQESVERIDEQLQTLINKRTIEEEFPTRPAVMYRAKYKDVKEANDYIQSMQMLYYSISFIFMAMAVLNYFNVMYTSLLNRRNEFVTLENIGMTHMQLRNIVLYEGLQYCTLIILLLLLPGTLVLYYINRFIQAARIEIIFRYPTAATILLIFINIMISIFLSLFIYQKVKKQRDT